VFVAMVDLRNCPIFQVSNAPASVLTVKSLRVDVTNKVNKICEAFDVLIQAPTLVLRSKVGAAVAVQNALEYFR
jgi:hypothetical protein